MPRKRLSEIDFKKDEVIALAKDLVKKSEGCYESLFIVLDRTCELPEDSCSINLKAGEGISIFVGKWVGKYLKGYSNRASQRTSNAVGTVHDSIIDTIISARLPKIDKKVQRHIKYGHRLSMSAENIAGAYLEEYLASKLINYKWHCCWGDTMRSIDFCHADGRVLQVKNSDNSENSSSKTVRNNTEIEHWFRRFSKKEEMNWAAINGIVGIIKDEDKLSEDGFKAFVRSSVQNNNDCIFVEDEGGW